jgi:general secretion pathway protein G
MLKWLQALSRRTKGEKGVTLIEMLAVIVIIAVIAAIAVPVVLSAVHNSKTTTTKQDMTVIADALNRYAMDHDGHFPVSGWQTATDALKTYLVGNDQNDPSTYLLSIPKDPWGQEFYYWSDGTNYWIETAKAYSPSTSQGDVLYMSNHMSAPSNTTNP